MTIVEYIILALAFGLVAMVAIRPCAAKHRVRLSYGLVAMLVVAAVQSLMMAAGMFLGNVLCVDDVEAGGGIMSDYNTMVYLGLMVVVCVKLLSTVWRRGKEQPAYDISRWSTLLAMAFATGVNVLLVGLALGFIVSVTDDVFKAVVPLFVVVWLFGYWALMLGRQHTAIRERRWTVLAVLIMLVAAVFRVVEY